MAEGVKTRTHSDSWRERVASLCGYDQLLFGSVMVII